MTSLIWKNLVSQIFVKTEFEPYLGLLDFFPSVEQVKMCETLRLAVFHLENLVTRVLKNILKKNREKLSNSTC